MVSINKMNIRKVVPITCPGCGASLRAKRFHCPCCATTVEGDFELPLLTRLSPDEQALIVNLAKCGGSLKDLAQLYGVSYPTVRNRLDALVARLQVLERESDDMEKTDNA